MKKLWKLAMAGLLSLGLCLPMLACAKAPKANERIRVVLDWYPNAIHSFMYVAQEKGFYKEAGLDVELVMPSNPTDPLTLTAADQADIGLYYLQDVVQAVGTQELKLKSIGAIVHHPLSIVMALKEKNIKSPKDLVGKTVGYSSNTLSETIIQTMLKKNQIDPSSVKFIDVGWDLMSSLTSGNCDATLGAFVNHEVPVMEEEGLQVDYFFPYEYGAPKSYELLMVTSEKTLGAKKEALKAFLEASRKGFEETKKNPEAAIKLLLENQNKENFPLSESVERFSLQTLLPFMESEQEPFLSQELSVWEENILWEKENGIITKDVKAEDLVVDLLHH